MSVKYLEKISMWTLLFLISFFFVYFFNQNFLGATASAMATATVKTPAMVVHNHFWSRLKEWQTD